MAMASNRLSYEMLHDASDRARTQTESSSSLTTTSAKGMLVKADAGALRCPVHNVPYGSPLKPGDGEDEAALYERFIEKHPSARDSFEHVAEHIKGKHIALFLDYDGTLTPIVNDPDQALLSDEMRDTIRRLASVCPVSVVSGRGRRKVESFVSLPELYYAGSHGMDIAPPTEGRWSSTSEGAGGTEANPALRAAMRHVDEQLRKALKPIPGASVEDNTYSITAHFRRCSCSEDGDRVKAIVHEVVANLVANPPVLEEELEFPELKVTSGRKVLEVKPMFAWNKGRALRHIVGVLKKLSGYDDLFCLYIGDDRTDEDAFAVFSDQVAEASDSAMESGQSDVLDGIGILVTTIPKATLGTHTLKDPDEVRQFLEKLAVYGERDGRTWQ